MLLTISGLQASEDLILCLRYCNEQDFLITGCHFEEKIKTSLCIMKYLSCNARAELWGFDW